MRRISRYKSRGCTLRKEPTYLAHKGRVVAHLGLYLDRPLMEELRTLSERTDLNMSAHIAKALRLYLNRFA